MRTILIRHFARARASPAWHILTRYSKDNLRTKKFLFISHRNGTDQFGNAKVGHVKVDAFEIPTIHTLCVVRLMLPHADE